MHHNSTTAQSRAIYNNQPLNIQPYQTMVKHFTLHNDICYNAHHETSKIYSIRLRLIKVDR